LLFFKLLYSQKIRNGSEDKICWDPSKKKIFEVKSYLLLGSIYSGTGVWSLKEYWAGEGSPESGFFLWSAALGKILTLNNLQKRNIMVMEWCYMCKQCGESIDYLFLHCEVATKLWNMFLQLFGVDWVMPCRVSDCLGSWRRQLVNQLVLHIWRMIPLCVIWCL
jgi:hypothetical protein